MSRPAANSKPAAGRTRVWSRRLGYGLIGLIALATAVGSWLSFSQSGLHWLWNQVADRPELAGLQVDGLSGRMIGPIRIESLHWQGSEGSLSAAEVELEWSPFALWSNTLRVHRLSAASLTWQAAASGSPPAPEDARSIEEQWAWQWPLPALPLSIELDQLAIAEIGLRPATEAPSASVVASASEVGASAEVPAGLMFRDLRLAASYDASGALSLQQLSLRTPWAELSQASGAGSASAPWTLRLRTLGDAPSEWLIRIEADRDRLQMRAAGESDQASIELGWSKHDLQLSLDVAELDLNRYGLAWPTPLSAQVKLESDYRQVKLEGSWQGHALAMEQLALELSWPDDLAELRLDQAQWRFAQGGQGRANGRLQLDRAAPELELDWRLSDMPLGTWLPATAEPSAEPTEAPRLMHAEGQLSGPFDRLALQGSAELSALERSLSLAWSLDARPEIIEIERLELLSIDGQAELSGTIGLGPRTDIRLDFQSTGLDPYWLLPHWQGKLDLLGKLDVKEGEQGWSGEIQVERIDGEINGQTLEGELQLQLQQGAARQLQAELRAGSGRLRLSPSSGNSASLQLTQWQLDPWWPDLRGRLDGELTVGDLPQLLSTAPAAWRDLRFELRAEQLSWADTRVGHAHLHGHWPGPGEAGGELSLQWTGLTPDDLGEWQGEIELRGRPESYQLVLGASRDELRVSLQAEGEHSHVRRRLALQKLSFDSDRAGRWALQAPFAVDYSAALGISPACMSGDLGELCLSMDSEAKERRWRLQAQQLQLDRMLKLVVPNDGLQLSGEVDLQLDVRERDGAWRPALLQLSGSAGEIRSLDQDVQLLGWDSLAINGAAADNGTEWRASGQLLSGVAGELEFELTLPLAEQPVWNSMRGTVRIGLRQIAALQLLLPDVLDAKGAADGELNWALDRTPVLSGELRLTALGGKVPALGVEFAESELTLFGNGESLNLDGQLRSGGGPLRVEGEWQSNGLARVRLAGEQVRLADTRRLKIVASPDVLISWQQGAAKLGGRVEVTEALVDLERIESGVTRSQDVVVLDPRFEAEGVQALPLNVDLQVQLGNAVRLVGFGFDGGIAGKLRITERPGEATRGRGALNLSGKYTAYAQDLEIERGRLLFANGPLDNPGIELRALRKVRRDKVGIEVRGPALAPRLSLWSEPPMNQAEALSLLVLGQPLSSASSAEGAQLGQAAAAMGGNLLAAKVGGRLGLDTFGVSDSSSIGAAFTVGKYLSPRLYLAYGVALFEDASAVTVRYLISERLDLEIESSRESRAGINYRLER